MFSFTDNQLFIKLTQLKAIILHKDNNLTYKFSNEILCKRMNTI